MASLIDVGYVSPLNEDVLPSTGAHLDVRVRKDGKYINPETIRSLLTRLKSLPGLNVLFGYAIDL